MNQVTRHVVTMRKAFALDAQEPEMYAWPRMLILRVEEAIETKEEEENF